jgi:linoleoyl-CoA desaturase
MSIKNHLVFWVTKLYYITVFIIVPIFIWGWLGWFIGFLTLNAVMGITLSFVFQLAHVVEHTDFEHVNLDDTIHLETAWAEHQVKTTANFSMDNPVISWFVGGLNFQIEHHLFPKVSHVHYPAISKIVQQKCKEFSLPYHQNKSLFKALSSHFTIMKQLGKKPAIDSMSIQ